MAIYYIREDGRLELCLYLKKVGEIDICTCTKEGILMYNFMSSEEKIREILFNDSKKIRNGLELSV